ncbi:MAG: MBL fold metallo-hydrolase [Firmicutes bacterium]|nr:MBL fold metallo-hydrolase [Bacillota bacterium]
MTAPVPLSLLAGVVDGLTLAPHADWPSDPPNVYRVQGAHAWAMVDAGWGREEDVAALEAWLDASPPRGRPAALFVTHAHRDHVGGSPYLARRWGLAPRALPAEAATAARHGIAFDFAPLAPGESLDLGGGIRLTAVPTPGHTPGSLAVHLTSPGGDVLFTGDTVVGRHSSWVGPPDGDLDAYLETLARLGDPQRPYAGALLAPGHGPAGAQAGPVALALRRRRLEREAEILRLLPLHPTPRALVVALYGAGEGLVLGPGGVAERTVFAHLERLVRLGRAVRLGGEADFGLQPFAPA